MAKAPRRPGNLPAEATSFIGRRRELSELRRTLAAARLVSLVGPGGVGKTRLAIRIATDLARGFPWGAWLVELAEIQDPALVPNAVFAALDLKDQSATAPMDVLLAYLQDKDLLLVVDNCEHLLDATAQVVTAVVKAAPNVRVLTTTREPLSVPGERVVAVPPLDLPAAAGAELLAQLRQNEAVMLFTERAVAAAGGFELTSANQATVVDLCRRLDGLPLAIELAAVRTRVLAVEQILDHLTDRFDLLTGGSRAALPRHQTLRTTIDWSYDLLAEAERTLLRRLSVFAASFDLRDIEAVCMSPALEALSSLVDKSLVTKDDGDRVARYRLHETMREYARLKLREAGEVETVHERCVEHYVSACRRSIDEGHYRLVEWLAWIDSEIDNIRAVLQQCLLKADFPRGTNLAGSVGWYWITRAMTEGVRWLDAFLADERGDPAALAQAYFIRGFLATLQIDAAAAVAALNRAAALSQDPQLAVESFAVASVALNLTGEHMRAEPLLEEAEKQAAALGEVATSIAILQARATNAFVQGDMDTMNSASRECARLSREKGDLYTLAYCLINLGFGGLLTGELRDAKEFFEEALRVAREFDDRLTQFYSLAALGCLAASSGEPRLAAQLLGAAENVRTSAGASVNVMLAPLLAHAQESAAKALGGPKFEAEFAAGKRLSRDAAARLALGKPPESVDEASKAAVTLLGRREEDIAKLVAEGLSNKQIGSRLFISERTVESHVRSILNKLGFNSRAQIAAWMSASHQ